MDTEQLISHSRARFDHEAAKRTLNEKYQGKLTFAYRGGMWQAGPELQCTIFTCGQIGEIVLLDLYKNPVKIDTTELMTLSQQRWQEQMTAWLAEYEQLSRKR
jgi:hypothetical protein